MSAPFQKVHFFCLFGKIWIKNPPLSSALPTSLFLATGSWGAEMEGSFAPAASTEKPTYM